MKAAAFARAAPTSLDEAVRALVDAGPDARVLAGGQSLMPLMAARAVRPNVVVDLAGVPGLDTIEVRDDRLVIGAMVRQRAVERSELVLRHTPLLVHAVRRVAHATVRNQGTVGGSLAHADPAAEIPVATLALDATVVVHGPSGRREIEASALFIGPQRTVLGAGDVLVEVRYPLAAPNDRVAFDEVSRRPGDPALACVAAVVRVGDDGVVTSARLALGAVAPTPVRARGAEGLLVGQRPTAALAAETAAAACAALAPTDDVHATGAYRRHLCGVLVRRALTAAIGDAVAGSTAGGRA